MLSFGFLETVPGPALAAALYALSWLPFIPLIKANYGGLSGLPGQIGFTFLLHLPVFLYCIAGLWLSPLTLIVPVLLTAAFDAFVVRDYFGWTGSTSALGLFVLLPGEAVLLAIGFGVSWFAFK